MKFTSSLVPVLAVLLAAFSTEAKLGTSTARVSAENDDNDIFNDAMKKFQNAGRELRRDEGTERLLHGDCHTTFSEEDCRHASGICNDPNTCRHGSCIDQCNAARAACAGTPDNSQVCSGQSSDGCFYATQNAYVCQGYSNWPGRQYGPYGNDYPGYIP